MASPAVAAKVDEVLAALRSMSSEKTRDELVRYGIITDKAMGVGMAAMQQLAKRVGRSHELALALWETGWYEARTVAVFVAEPERVTPAQMDRWCKDFDNWGICDTVCFKLFDQTPHAFGKVAQWAKRKNEFEKRAAFALLACLALHDKKSGDVAFRKCLPLIEQAAADDRNFVKKGVSWALRAIGRRPTEVSAEARMLAQRLAASSDPASRWVGNDTLKDLAKARAMAEKRREKSGKARRK